MSNVNNQQAEHDRRHSLSADFGKYRCGFCLTIAALGGERRLSPKQDYTVRHKCTYKYRKHTPRTLCKLDSGRRTCATHVLVKTSLCTDLLVSAASDGYRESFKYPD